MESEEVIEEIIVSVGPWYSYFSTEEWVVLAVSIGATVLGVLAWRRLQEKLPAKLVLAGASGLVCYAVFDFGFDGQWPSLLFHSVSGALFATGVLFPYLRRDGTVWARALGLIATSTISYWCAIETFFRSSSAMSWNDTMASVAASLVGAGIALAGARFLVPLHRSGPLAVAGLAAAITGGIVFGLTIHSHAYIAFLGWHSLIALAIHAAESSPGPSDTLEGGNGP